MQDTGDYEDASIIADFKSTISLDFSLVRISIVKLHVYCYSGIKDGITIHLVVKSQNKVSFSFVIVIIMNIKLTPTVICCKKTLPLFFFI